MICKHCPTPEESALLNSTGLKILLVCFEGQLNSEWFRIARTIREMGTLCSHDEIRDGTAGGTADAEEPLWKFLEFVTMYRSPLYSLLLPFIRTRVQVSLDSDHVRSFQMGTKDKITQSSVVHRGKSKCIILAELGQELGSLRDQLNKRLQGEHSGHAYYIYVY